MFICNNKIFATYKFKFAKKVMINKCKLFVSGGFTKKCLIQIKKVCNFIFILKILPKI